MGEIIFTPNRYHNIFLTECDNVTNKKLPMWSQYYDEHKIYQLRPTVPAAYLVQV
jgi:hypothetical protein